MCVNEILAVGLTKIVNSERWWKIQKKKIYRKIVRSVPKIKIPTFVSYEPNNLFWLENKQTAISKK